MQRLTEAEAAAILADDGYQPDHTGTYYAWDGAGYSDLTALDMLAIYKPFTCRRCGKQTRNPALCRDCVNDAEARDVPY